MEKTARHLRPKFRRLARMPREHPGTLFAEPPSAARSRSVQDLDAGGRQLVRVTNRPARHPRNGLWPLELRADTLAALLDFETTRELCKAIAAGTAPRPSAVRVVGGSKEAVWSLAAVRRFVALRHGTVDEGEA
jgi:hypothetical protein